MLSDVWSCASDHSCCEFMSAIVLPCPEATVLFLSSDFLPLLTRWSLSLQRVIQMSQWWLSILPPLKLVSWPVVSFCVNHHALLKEKSLMWFESCTNLWVEKYQNRGLFDTMSFSRKRVGRVCPGACWFLARFAVPAYFSFYEDFQSNQKAIGYCHDFHATMPLSHQRECLATLVIIAAYNVHT